MAKLITAIVLTYNNGDLLFETIDSILSQDYPRIELIIADDYDEYFNTTKIKNYILEQKKSNIERLLVYKNENNLGTVKSLNTALGKSSGDYIKIIAGDDIFPTSSIFSKQIDFLENRPDSFFVVSDIVQCDADLKAVESLGFYNHNVDISSLFVSNKNKKAILRFFPYLLSIQAICFRKEYFYRFGLFDERYKLIEDLPFLVKVLDNGIVFSYLRLDSVMHRCDVGVSSRNNGVFDPKKIDYYNDLYNYFCFDLVKYKSVVGRFNYSVRKRMALFKLQYTSSRSKLLFIKFFPVSVAYLFIRK